MTPGLEQEIRELRSLFWSERDPDGRAFVPLADACRRAGELSEALELLRDGLDRLPEFTSGHVVSAWLHRDRGDLAAAEAAYRRVLELDPENARALHGLGQMLARAGSVPAGRELVLRAVELDPLLEWEEGRGPPAEDEDAGGIELPSFPPPSPETDEAMMAVAESDVVDIRALAPDPVDGVLGDPDGRGVIVEISALAPEGALARSTDAGALVDHEGLPAETVGADAGVPDDGHDADVVDIRELAPDELAPHEHAHDPDAAAAVATDTGAAGAEDTGDVHFTRTMAELLERQGFHDRALEVYRHLLQRRPGDTELQRHLEELLVRIGSEGGATSEEPAEARSSAPPPEDHPAAAWEASAEDYLQGLLSWRRSGDGDGHGREDE